jgi:hypothetical protein
MSTKKKAKSTETKAEQAPANQPKQESRGPVEDGYDQNRMITPVMAVCAISGDAGKVPENGQGEAPEEA